MLLGQVQRTLERANFNRKGDDPVLVACSGGVDSVVLAHAAVELLGARRVVLGHVDHQVRPDSAEDAKLVQTLAERLGAEAVLSAVQPASCSEADLRAARYEALETQRVNAQAEWILTAHTEDDQAESVLIGLIRSTQPESLQGIPEQRERILRPLLRVSRSAVTEYARKHRLKWKEDPSNKEPRYLRNRIRKELLPLLERRYRPGIRKRLAALSWTLLERSRVYKKRREPKAPSEQKSCDYPSWTETGGPAVVMQCQSWRGGAIADGAQVAYFDADVLSRPVVRLFEAGDRIQPFGMDGRKKLTEVLREARIPAEQRASYPVVADQTGAVMWVPGVLRSAFAPVGDKTTKVWVFSIKEVRKTT